MTTLVVFHDGDREYVVIDTRDLSDTEFIEEYGGRPEYRANVSDASDIVPFPTDRELRQV